MMAVMLTTFKRQCKRKVIDKHETKFSQSASLDSSSVWRIPRGNVTCAPTRLTNLFCVNFDVHTCTILFTFSQILYFLLLGERFGVAPNYLSPAVSTILVFHFISFYYSLRSLASIQSQMWCSIYYSEAVLKTIFTHR